MLTKRKNLMETIKGQNPDRFVKQFEYMELMGDAPHLTRAPKGGQVTNEWGITFYWPEDQLGHFPLHDEEHLVCRDISHWDKYVKAPSVDYPEEMWAPSVKRAQAVDRDEKFVTAFLRPGIFEMTHHLSSMEGSLMGFYLDPPAMHDFLDYLADYEIRYMEKVIEHLKPDALYHHDDWGGQETTFMSVEMFEEFILPRYKRIYGFCKENGIELIIHHSDSYAATLVPHMIEMGIDIWQGVMTTNNIPGLIDQYGGKISFMGGLDSGEIDRPGWTTEKIRSEVERACTECGKHYFIPNLTQGGPGSSFPGVFEETDKAIDEMSKKLFKKTVFRLFCTGGITRLSAGSVYSQPVT